MYLLVVYDIAQERVNKVMKICREYLDHVQNSVFEGEITSVGFKELEGKIKKVIDKESDSVLVKRRGLTTSHRSPFGTLSFAEFSL